MKRAKYTEPADYIPKDVRKELKLGEFAEEEKTKETKEKREANKAIRNFVNGKDK